MAKVIQFPGVKKLPKETEEGLYKIATEYIKVLYDALDKMSGDDPTDAEFDEVNKLVAIAYVENMSKAIDDFEKGL